MIPISAASAMTREINSAISPLESVLVVVESSPTGVSLHKDLCSLAAGCEVDNFWEVEAGLHRRYPESLLPQGVSIVELVFEN